MAIEHRVASALLESRSLAEAAPGIVRAVCENLGWECGACWIRDDECDTLSCVADWGLASPGVERFLDAGRRLSRSKQACGLIARARTDGMPFWVDDVCLMETFGRARAAREAGLRGAFAFPITADIGVIGALEFFSRDEQPPDADLFDCARSLGRQLGQFWQRARTLSDLRDREERFRSTAELAAIGIAHVDAAGRFIFANHWLCDLLGYRREELLGLTVKEISHPEDKDVTDEVRARLRSGEIKFFRLEKRYLRRNHSTLWVALTISAKRNAAGEPLYEIAVFEDITARKKAEAHIQHLALHDSLTGLPNRVLFSQLLGRAVESARRHERTLAVLFIDLDGFKAINDTLGHEAGDLLLQEIAARLKCTLRSSDVVTRLGGDEFVVLLPELRDADMARTVARSLLSAVLNPVGISGRECSVSASIGISVFPTDARDENALMRNADAAMYLAKQRGKNDFIFYAAGSRAAATLH